MRGVKIRILTEVCNGIVNHIEEDTTYEEAEYMFDLKLDRRRNYMIIDGQLCQAVEYTDICTGCNGGGCVECGGHGKVRHGYWV